MRSFSPLFLFFYLIECLHVIHYLVHVRKRNTLVNGPIVTADYHTKSEITRRKTELDQPNDYFRQQNTVQSPSIDTDEESKHVRPYFLIRPQSVLVLPNESGRLTKIILLISHQFKKALYYFISLLLLCF